MTPQLLHLARDALLDALAVISPVECAGCGEPDRSLCAACRRQLVLRPTESTLPGGLLVTSALRYEGAVRRVILAFKESNRTDVAGALARTLEGVVREASAGPIDIVPVPTSRSAWRRRGYDPVALICDCAGLRPLRALVQTRSTRSQKTLGATERASNLAGSMAARRRLTGRKILLVDDVLTTGATLAEAERAARQAGAEIAGAVTLAFTPRYYGGERKSPVTSDEH
ncbi:ComF family protein [Glaciihabitans sp. dw_435]|uniref:ComF family protein n=1 Tax=Glaciihabitans sp. dw_435 TaxID=2720081 RepID=UPI001BD4353E|nr:phosphoribosyltransferase family protein [Glaciihabitans sp. dw_435]